VKVPRHQLAAILAERSLGSVKPGELSAEIAAYLLEARRTGELDSLLRDIMQYRAEHGIVEVNAISVFALSEKVRKDIEATIRGLNPDAKKVVVTETRDESVVGGVRLELANQQLDLSIRSKLNRFKQLTAVGKES